MDKWKALGIIDEWASIFNVRLEHLDNNDLIKIINEIKEMKYHFIKTVLQMLNWKEIL